jgi:hypothetical protein
VIGESFEQLDLRRSEGAHFGERALDFPIELINTSLQSTS